MAHRSNSTRTQRIQNAIIIVGRPQASAAMLSERKQQQYPFTDMPIIVLSRGVPEYTDPKDRATEDEHNKNQADLVKLSRNAKQVIAEHSRHHILMEEPDLVATSIHDVLALARK